MSASHDDPELARQPGSAPLAWLRRRGLDSWEAEVPDLYAACALEFRSQGLDLDPQRGRVARLYLLE
jgi:hypothetical protein